MYGRFRGFGSYGGYGGYPYRSLYDSLNPNISDGIYSRSTGFDEETERLAHVMEEAGFRRGDVSGSDFFHARMEYVRAHPGQYPGHEICLGAYDRMMSERGIPPGGGQISGLGSLMGGRLMTGGRAGMSRPSFGGISGGPPPRTTPGGGRGSRGGRRSGFSGRRRPSRMW